MGLSLVSFLLDHVMFLCTNTLVPLLLYAQFCLCGMMGLQHVELYGACGWGDQGCVRCPNAYPPTLRLGACTACTLLLRL